MIPVGSLVTSAAAGSAHPAILLRRRPADSRPAACRIILIRDSGGDGVIGEPVHISTTSALGDAINLLPHRAGVGVDVDGDGFRRRIIHPRIFPAQFDLVSAGRTTMGLVGWIVTAYRFRTRSMTGSLLLFG